MKGRCRRLKTHKGWRRLMITLGSRRSWRDWVRLWRLMARFRWRRTRLVVWARKPRLTWVPSRLTLGPGRRRLVQLRVILFTFKRGCRWRVIFRTRVAVLIVFRLYLSVNRRVHLKTQSCFQRKTSKTVRLLLNFSYLFQSSVSFTSILKWPNCGCEGGQCGGRIAWPGVGSCRRSLCDCLVVRVLLF